MGLAYLAKVGIPSIRSAIVSGPGEHKYRSFERDANFRAFKYFNKNKVGKTGVGPKALEQAIGFLRIVDGNEPLDMTGIHPESYAAARAILEKLGFSSANLGNVELVEKVKAITPEQSVALQQ